MTNTEILGNKLYELRKEARLSQEEFADKIGVSRQAVSKWERGETLPDMDNLITIAKLFKTSLDWLIDNETTTNLNENSKDLVNEENANQSEDDNFSDFDVDCITNPNLAIEKQINQTEKTPKNRIIIGIENIPYAILVTIAYLIWGFFADGSRGWSIGWTLFLTIPVFDSIIDCFKYKKVEEFCYPVFVAFIYCLIGMAWNLWHPYWVIFITVPIFDIIAEVIDR